MSDDTAERKATEIVTTARTQRDCIVAVAALLRERDAEIERESQAAKLWRDECGKIVDALADLAGVPRDPCPGWQPAIQKLQAELSSLRSRLACDACDGSGQAISGPCGCKGKGLPGMLASVRETLAETSSRLEAVEKERDERSLAGEQNQRLRHWFETVTGMKDAMFATMKAEIERRLAQLRTARVEAWSEALIAIEGLPDGIDCSNAIAALIAKEPS